MQALLPAVRVAVVIVWIVLVAMLFRGPSAPEGPPPTVLTPAAAGAAPEAESWTGFYLHERKIGYSHQRVLPQADGYRIEQESLLRVTVLATEQTVRAVVQGETGPDYALRSFTVALTSGAGTVQARGTVDARELSLTIRTGGDESSQRFAVTEPIYLPSAVRRSLVREGFEPGRQLAARVFDPSAMQSHPLLLTVEERERLGDDEPPRHAWRVREEFRGLRTTVWFDDQGTVVREQGPMGLVALRESAEEAVFGGWQDGAPLDLIAAVAVPVPSPIRAPRDLARLEVRLGGIADVPVPADGRQRPHDGGLVVEREELAAAGTFALPYRGRQWQGELAPTPFLQVDHPRIRAAAGEALGGETDARGAAERLRRWVFHRLQKVATASIPNALQVLDLGAGDCNEHAVLFAALARAAGLPARVVAGAVYMDGAFLYHAWNEVWLGSAWVSVDAALDQMPADATHIKFVEGGPEAHVAMVPIIGRLSVDIVAAE